MKAEHLVQKAMNRDEWPEQRKALTDLYRRLPDIVKADLRDARIKNPQMRSHDVGDLYETVVSEGMKIQPQQDYSKMWWVWTAILQGLNTWDTEFMIDYLAPGFPFEKCARSGEHHITNRDPPDPPRCEYCYRTQKEIDQAEQAHT